MNAESITVRLTQRWTLGSQIGEGGFGRVFEAVGDNGVLAAAKLIPKQPGADRELLFENLADVRCVVPVVDRGESGDCWVLVMPRAEKSLRAHLTERGTLRPEEAVAILTDVVTALTDLEGRVVHRDIKPENLLLLNGQWCLSDFGIARYAEASTAPDTRKWVFTKAYNAPERWRDERATSASDIYSMGVMAFEMLSGRRPFPGPDFRQQHLTEDPPLLTDCPAPLASVVTQCLLKAPEVRPRPADLLSRLPLILRPSSPAGGSLQAANAAHVRRLATETAAQSAARSHTERRREIIASATKALSLVAEELGQSIRSHAPAAVWQMGRADGFLGSSATLGRTVIRFGLVQQSPTDPWGRSGPRFQVICHSTITVETPPDRFQHEGKSHSLWFCDAKDTGVFRWYETAFTYAALTGMRNHQDPFALGPCEEAGKALGPAMHVVQVGWQISPVEPGNCGDFVERWMNWFAEAAQGDT